MPSQKNQFDYDVAILGSGSAGYAAARKASHHGLRTVIIESAEEIEGLCILRGCMPTKALLYAAEVMHLATHSGLWGVHAEKVGFDLAEVMARKTALVKDFADYRREQLTSGKFQLIRAKASFLTPHTISLDNNSSLSASHFVITVGSRMAPSPLPQLHKVGYLTSDDAIKLTKLPRSLIILGGGAIALELSQLFSRFGVKVTLLQRSEHLLSEFDTDAALEIEKVLRREGVEVITNTQLTDARRDGLLKTIVFQRDGQTASVSAEEILFSLGRVPNTASLDLENAQVSAKAGRIITNASMQTSAAHIFAAGDCTGPHESVHLAVQQGEIAADNIAKPKTPRQINYRLLLRVIFTEPQVAVVGLTEKAAVKEGIPFLSARYLFSDHGKALIMGATDGFVKLLADPKTGEILGGACVGPSGGELIHEIVIAMAKHMTVHELADVPHYHPTLAEIWTYPAEELAGQILLAT